MSENYYDSIIEKLQTLIKQKNYNEALVILNNELSLPYVPSDFENNLLKFKKEIISELKLAEKINELNHLNPEEIINILKRTSDENAHINAVSNLKDINLRVILNDLEDLMASNNITDLIKTYILIEFYKQDINKEIKVFKNYLGNFVFINPSSIDYKHYFAITTIIDELIDRYIISNDISVAEICRNIFRRYQLSVFPKLFDFDFSNEDILMALIKISHNYLGINFSNDDYIFNNNQHNVNKIYKIIKDVLDNERDFNNG